MEQQEQDVLLDDDYNSELLLSSLYYSWWKFFINSKNMNHIPRQEEMLPRLLQQKLLQQNEEHVDDSSSSIIFSSSWLPRFLAESSSDSYDDLRMDYSVLAVCVLTLGLILVVEVLRHTLDHLAHGRPYFTAVLENVYAECTYSYTIRILYACMHTILLHRYQIMQE
jgi:hypothetical protein